MNTDPYADRRALTFEQAEGAEEIPTQLRLREVSRRLRSRLWFVVFKSIEISIVRPDYGKDWIRDPWLTILRDDYVFRRDGLIDEFTADATYCISYIKKIFVSGNYVSIFGFLQHVIRHEKCPFDFINQISWALEDGRAAYRVLDGTTIVPICSEEDAAVMQRAFTALANAELGGARSHLRLAAENLTAGNYAESIRESIHAVESVARIIGKTKELSSALKRLEIKAQINGALKSGFTSIYGYTCEEQGIRHALLEAGQPAVDEVDAMFMLGACSSFVTYLIRKGDAAGLLG